MLGNPLGDDDFSQRMWNMIIFKTPLTDRELEDAMPVLALLGLTILIIAGVAWILGLFNK